MTTSCQPRPVSDPQPGKRILIAVLWFFVGYWVLSCLTIPFAGRVWSGEIPVLALIQIPKIAIAEWIRTNVVMKIITDLGFSSGSFSPDYLLARPYALVIAYLIPIVIIGVIGLCFHFRFLDKPQRFVAIAFLVAAITDCLFTLRFGGGPGFTLYG